VLEQCLQHNKDLEKYYNVWIWISNKRFRLLGRQLKHQIKRTQKTPDKMFKHVNLDTVKHTNPRTKVPGKAGGKTYDIPTGKICKR